MAKDKICTPFLALASPENKFTVSTIEDMKGRKYLKIGDVVELNGYYTAGDGAGHKRKIEATDDGSGVQLANGLWANIVHNGEVYLDWYGDSTIGFEKAFENNDIKIIKANKDKCKIKLTKSVSRKSEILIDLNNGEFLFDTENHMFTINLLNPNDWVKTTTEEAIEGDSKNRTIFPEFIKKIDENSVIYLRKNIPFATRRSNGEDYPETYEEINFKFNLRMLAKPFYRNFSAGSQLWTRKMSDGSVFSNFKIVLKFPENYKPFNNSCFFNIEQDNMSIQDIQILPNREASVTDEVDYRGAVFNFDKVVFVNIKNIKGGSFSGNDTYENFSLGSAGYVFTGRNIVSLTARDCEVLGRTSLVSVNGAHEMFFENLKGSRVDVHYFCSNTTVKNCTFMVGGLLFGEAHGDIVITDCNLLNDGTIATRQDYESYVHANWHLENITFQGGNIDIMSRKFENPKYEYQGSVEFGDITIKNIKLFKSLKWNAPYNFIKIGHAKSEDKDKKYKCNVNIENVEMCYDGLIHGRTGASFVSFENINLESFSLSNANNIFNIEDQLPIMTNISTFTIENSTAHTLFTFNDIKSSRSDVKSIFLKNVTGIAQYLDGYVTWNPTNRNGTIIRVENSKIMFQTFLSSTYPNMTIAPCDKSFTNCEVFLAPSRTWLSQGFVDFTFDELSINNYLNCKFKLPRICGETGEINPHRWNLNNSTPKTENSILNSVFEKKEGEIVPSWVDEGRFNKIIDIRKSETFNLNLFLPLNTPYHATKMQQEGVYEDFIQYMDDKTEYDRVQRELEQQRQLEFEQRENQEQTYEEWLAEQPMLLPVESEPQPSEKLLVFKEKYLG